MHPITTQTHARVTRLLDASSADDAHALLQRIVSTERESAALLLQCVCRSDAYQWVHVGVAGDQLWSELVPMTAVMEEVVRTRVPAMRRVSAVGAVVDGDALIVPVEPPEGAPVGVLIVWRDRRFGSQDVDFYRLVGLRISDLVPGPPA